MPTATSEEPRREVRLPSITRKTSKRKIKPTKAPIGRNLNKSPVSLEALILHKF